METILIASDHAGLALKEELKVEFADRVHFEDLGAHTEESVSYSDYGARLGQKAQREGLRGIAICGSGIGISIAVNRFKGIRGALCRDEDDARLSRAHNDSNLLCLGSRKTEAQLAKKIVSTWLTTDFEGGRHLPRVKQLDH